MKKALALIAGLLLLPAAVHAETVVSVTANGIVKASDTYDITAPFSGTLLPFSAEQGDEVAVNDPLFVLDTQQIYAPEDGIVTLFAAPGDHSQDVMQQYGMLASITKPNPYRVRATTFNAHKDNKFLHIGEALYFHLSSDKDEEGEGRVIAVEGNAYIVEITQGSFQLDKKVKLFREKGKGNNARTGEGTIVRAPEAPVFGDGRVLRCTVADGQQVQKGALLFELVSADCPSDVTSEAICTARSGVLGSLQVAAGQQVYKGQVLVTLHDTSSLKVVAEVDEVDLHRVQVGGTVSLAFDALPGQTLPGTVTRISGLGTLKQNATYFDVDITFANAPDIRLFMNATVTLP